jgi:hypothetical protein
MLIWILGVLFLLLFLLLFRFPFLPFIFLSSFPTSTYSSPFLWGIFLIFFLSLVFVFHPFNFLLFFLPLFLFLYIFLFSVPLPNSLSLLFYFPFFSLQLPYFYSFRSARHPSSSFFSTFFLILSFTSSSS